MNEEVMEEAFLLLLNTVEDLAHAVDGFESAWVRRLESRIEKLRIEFMPQLKLEKEV